MKTSQPDPLSSLAAAGTTTRAVLALPPATSRVSEPGVQLNYPKSGRTTCRPHGEVAHPCDWRAVWAAILLLHLGLTTLRATPNVVAWGGYNEYGQRDVPADLTNAVAVAAGYYHSVALRADGTVTAWGAGRVNTGSLPHNGQSMVPPGLSNVVAVAAGYWHSLALRRDGTVVAWGGDPGAPAVTNVTTGLTDVVAIAGGVGLRADGTVVTWGDEATTNVPPDLSNVVAVGSGSMFNLAVRADGTAVGWGDVTRSGNLDMGQTRIPVGLTNAVAVAAGYYHSMALRADGTVVAWGEEACSKVPPGLSKVVAVAGALTTARRSVCRRT